MDDKLTIFIAVTAAAVVLQMLILAGMYFALRKLNARVLKVTEDVQSHVLPVLESAKTLQADAKNLFDTTRPKVELIVDNLSAVSATARSQAQKVEGTLNEFLDRARLQVIRTDELVTRTFDRVEDTTAKVQHTVASPIRHLNGILTGLGVGLGSFFEKQKRGRSGAAQDEMFI